jgi:ubiquinone/menaquinone biosynthesis C-methylase UbiE
MVSQEQVRAGQAIYSPWVLKIYDAYVLGFSNHAIWRCPTAELRGLYDRNVSAHHLDVGVGTGYFLDKARWPVAVPRLVLMDLNAHSLHRASQRLQRFHPVCLRANALEPSDFNESFDSLGLNYLFHCLPGSLADKAVVLDHLLPRVQDGGRVFGATLLQQGVQRRWADRRLMDIYNRKGIFSNTSDSLADLESTLSSRLRNVRITVRGVAALFEGTKAESDAAMGSAPQPHGGGCKRMFEGPLDAPAPTSWFR